MVKFWRRLLAIIAIPLIVGLYLLVLQFNGNFHEVIPGELYRSAQMEPGELPGYIEKYHIRSVLNLRGENFGSGWYENELKEAAAHGVEHINFKMSSSRELTFQQALTLINIMRDAPKPLLIHCRAGADRTGLASALYIGAIAQHGEWAAERQLWLSYGHLPLRINGAYAMNRTFEMMEPFLGFPDS